MYSMMDRALVGSQSHGDRTYTVYNDRCACPDSLRTPRCKHVLAVTLLQQASERMHTLIEALATFAPTHVTTAHALA